MTHKKFFYPRILLIIWWFVSSLSLAQAHSFNKLEGVRIWSAPDSTRVVFDLTKKADFSYFSLTKPDRLVVDFKNTTKQVNLKKITNNSKLVKRIRLSRPPKKGTLRLVVDLNRPIKTNLFTLSPTPPYGNRLVVDLEGINTKPKPIIQPKTKLRDVIVAIDAGHGGEDPGSNGPTRIYEKNVTLQIAKRLAKKINAMPGMRAVMTRTGDYYVNLNQRSEIARKYKADLLISIHADAFTSPQPRGASVWVLSRRRANTEIGRWLEQKEKHSELLGGAGNIIQNADHEQYLAMTLLDMSMDRSMAISHHVAGDILSDLGKITRLHKAKPESASFAVLKAPDIPSILVETGFISNPIEEKQLANSRHQERIADAVKRGVVRYFATYPPENTLLAHKVKMTHQVKNGESLSVIAQRYGVSVVRLRKDNNLTSDMLHVGQHLRIPRS